MRQHGSPDGLDVAEGLVGHINHGPKAIQLHGLHTLRLPLVQGCCQGRGNDNEGQYWAQSPGQAVQHSHGTCGLQQCSQAPVSGDIVEHEAAQGIQLNRDEGGQLSGAVLVEEFHLLHEQRAEELQAQGRKHLHARPLGSSA